MPSLLPLHSYIRSFVDLFSAALDIDITIADNRGCCLGSTYPLQFGAMLSNRYLVVRSAKESQAYFIVDPQTDSFCDGCKRQQWCTEVCFAFPIQVNGATLGALSFIGRTEQQRKRLLDQQDTFEKLGYELADLLATKAVILEDQALECDGRVVLNPLLEFMGQAALFVDFTGAIEMVTSSAEKLLNMERTVLLGKAVTEILPGLDIRDLFESSREVYSMPSRVLPLNALYYINIYPLLRQGSASGIMVTIGGQFNESSNLRDWSIGKKKEPFERLIGNNKQFLNAIKVAQRVAQSKSSVLLLGESGTGKEMFARAIHETSLRNEGPFIAVNCAAIPEQLLESELFGYEDGAFTGARRGGHVGKLESANNGTVLLDEIGDMPLLLQAKLLRVLQDGDIQRVGSNRTISLDIRVIASTNKDLAQMISDGQFRSDLYYRLCVIPITLPPLRERTDDIPPLVDFFLRQYGRELGRDFRLDSNALSMLVGYSWPGNIRQMKNALEYAINIADDATITIEDLPEYLKYPGESSCNPSVDEVIPLAKLEEQAIISALQLYGSTTDGKRKAAAALGIDTTTLYRKLKTTKST